MTPAADESYLQLANFTRRYVHDINVALEFDVDVLRTRSVGDERTPRPNANRPTDPTEASLGLKYIPKPLGYSLGSGGLH